MMKPYITLYILGLGIAYAQGNTRLTYPIVDTGQESYYDVSQQISKPEAKDVYAGQDAGIKGNKPRYKDNGDGTISDLVTGLMWEQNMGQKMTLQEAEQKAKASRLGGYKDWRVPNIKELYSLIQFTGEVRAQQAVKFFIDTKYFRQPLGDAALGEREIDAQTWTSTIYAGHTMGTQETIFGVNFIDGRIKGYPVMKRGVPNRMYFRLVRGNAKYGINRFVDNKDGTISDLATGLMWQKADDGKCYTWDEALTYAQRLNLAGHKDWRLPNAKELQSIVDYSRCPETTKSPAISPLFKVSSMTMSNGVRDYPYFWTSTTHLDGPRPGNRAATICFGRAWGLHPRTRELTDVHGAGAQRGDIKTDTGHPMPQYQGPQSDLQSCRNAVRCVRTISPKKK